MPELTQEQKRLLVEMLTAETAARYATQGADSKEYRDAATLLALIEETLIN